MKERVRDEDRGEADEEEEEAEQDVEEERGELEGKKEAVAKERSRIKWKKKSGWRTNKSGELSSLLILKSVNSEKNVFTLKRKRTKKKNKKCTFDPDQHV